MCQNVPDFVVRGEGFEPPRVLPRQVLSLLRLPIPPAPLNAILSRDSKFAQFSYRTEIHSGVTPCSLLVNLRNLRPLHHHREILRSDMVQLAAVVIGDRFDDGLDAKPVSVYHYDAISDLDLFSHVSFLTTTLARPRQKFVPSLGL